jgi:hypothetical protein
LKVLVVGTARSGSTWAANVLGLAAETRQVYEPDGPMSDVLGAMVATRLGEFPVVAPKERSYWYRLVWDLGFAGGWPWDRVESARAAGRRLVRIPPAVRDGIIVSLAEATRLVRRRPRHVVVKSVNSVFSLDWIAERYAPRVLVLRRNPLNVVSSWLVLGQGVDHCLGDDPRVHATYLRPLGLTSPNGRASALTTAAWNVGLLTRAIKESTEQHPEWTVASFDEICTDPLSHFKALAGELGLTWTAAMEEYLQRSDDPGFTAHHGSASMHPNAVTATTDESRRKQQATQYKRRLTPEQVAEARSVLERFELGDWGPPPLQPGPQGDHAAPSRPPATPKSQDG